MKHFILLTAFFLSLKGYASEHDSTKVSNVLLRFFTEGEIHGNMRSFAMSTINRGILSDYYANALGASLHYETASFKGVKLGVNGIFIYRLYSNDLNEKDSLTGKVSKYERQLFDLEHPDNYSDLDRLEELYLEYNHKGTDIVIGKMEVESPLVKIHDGRMKPKVFSGIWARHAYKNLAIDGGWFLKASPRSTTHWHKIEDAIGIYNNGCLTDGTPAEYHGQLRSAGLGMLGLRWKKKKIEVTAWDYLLENISNTALIKMEYRKKEDWNAGLMYMNQLAVGNGGNDNPEYAFHQKEEKTHGISAKLGKEMKWFDLTSAATYLFNTGRYLFPRELGVDPFYTFVSRSQLEGFGNAIAFDLKLGKRINGWRFSVDWNKVRTSNEIRNNKYNLPSYDQYNVDVEYIFKEKWKGLKLRMLYVYRDATEVIVDPLQQFNKVDFHQLNIVLNFNF